MALKLHAKRLREELQSAGVSRLATRRFSSHYLPHVIHEDEHIEAAVFGRHKESEGLFGYIEGVLVATNKRVIYLDHRPGYTTMDEVTYDVVSGVNLTQAGFSSGVTLFTKVANYKVLYVNAKSAQKFVDYIEKRCIRSSAASSDTPHQSLQIDDEAVRFLSHHSTAVLSTVDRSGVVTGAVIYYMFENGSFYILTKGETRKAHNMLHSSTVALTIYDAEHLQTAQVQGIAHVETKPSTRERIYEALMMPRNYANGKRVPPVGDIQRGAFIVFRIVPNEISFSDFN